MYKAINGYCSWPPEWILTSCGKQEYHYSNRLSRGISLWATMGMECWTKRVFRCHFHVFTFSMCNSFCQLQIFYVMVSCFTIFWGEKRGSRSSFRTGIFTVSHGKFVSAVIVVCIIIFTSPRNCSNNGNFKKLQSCDDWPDLFNRLIALIQQLCNFPNNNIQDCKVFLHQCGLRIRVLGWGQACVYSQPQKVNRWPWQSLLQHNLLQTIVVNKGKDGYEYGHACLQASWSCWKNGGRCQLNK